MKVYQKLFLLAHGIKETEQSISLIQSIDQKPIIAAMVKAYLMREILYAGKLQIGIMYVKEDLEIDCVSESTLWRIKQEILSAKLA